MLLKSSFKISSYLNFSVTVTKAESVSEYGVKMVPVSRILYHMCIALVKLPFFWVKLDIFFALHHF